MTTRAYRLALMLYATAKKNGYSPNTWGCVSVKFDEIAARVTFQDPDIMVLRSAGLVSLIEDGCILDKSLLHYSTSELQEVIKAKLHLT